jgi:hypothetical protein
LYETFEKIPVRRRTNEPVLRGTQDCYRSNWSGCIDVARSAGTGRRVTRGQVPHCPSRIWSFPLLKRAGFTALIKSMEVSFQSRFGRIQRVSKKLSPLFSSPTIFRKHLEMAQTYKTSEGMARGDHVDFLIEYLHLYLRQCIDSKAIINGI